MPKLTLPQPRAFNMPGLSGLGLLPKAKAMRPDVAVIMVTAYGDAATKRRALENGAETLLTKPIDFVTLRNEIDLRVERAGWPLKIGDVGRPGSTAQCRLLDRFR